jgi:hypothetical protein
VVARGRYYCSLDGAGQRMDRTSRPELSLGSVDFLVNEDYCLRPAQEPVFVFALDISHKAVANGVTLAGIRAIKAALQRLRALEARFRGPPPPCPTAAAAYAAYAKPSAASSRKGTGAGSNGKSSGEKGPCKVRAAVVTFDRDVQFYTVDPASADPVKMFVVSGHEPLCPLPASRWLLRVTDQEAALDLLLQRIPELIAALHEHAAPLDSNHPADTAAGAKAQAGSGTGLRSYSSFSNVLNSGAGTPQAPRAGGTPRSRPLSGAGYDVSAGTYPLSCSSF